MNESLPTSDDQQATEAPERPWYCFLYTIFGAHGTFWLFIISLLGLYWTIDDVAIQLANLSPHTIEVEEIAKEDVGLQRWVRVRGLKLQVEDESPLLGPLPTEEGEEPAGPDIAPAYRQLLLDRSSWRAARWRWLLGQYQQVKRERERYQAGDSDDPYAWVRLFNQRLLPRLRPPDATTFRPQEALVIFDPTRSESSEPLPPGEEVGVAEQVLRRLQPQAEGSEADFAVEGFLEPLPPGIVETYRERYGIEVAELGLRVQGRPPIRGVWGFSICAVLLFFIVTGYVGILRTEGPVPPEEDEGETLEEAVSALTSASSSATEEVSPPVANSENTAEDSP